MKTVVLKLSGKALEGIYANRAWKQRLQQLQRGRGLVLVHGAGNSISEWSARLGCSVQFVNGQRVTTPDIMEVVTAVQAGLVNKTLTAHLQACGINCIGLSGIDRGLFTARQADPLLGRVGYPECTGDVRWLKHLLRDKTVPVFSSVCPNEQGELMNVNADIFAERLAEAVRADAVLFLSDVPGIVLDGRVQKLMHATHIASGIRQGYITGGMIPKLQSCLALLEKGVKKVWIGSEAAFDSGAGRLEQLRGTWIKGERA